MVYLLKFWTQVTFQKGLEKQCRTRLLLKKLLASILWIPAQKTNILFENRERKVFEILEHLLYIWRTSTNYTLQCSPFITHLIIIHIFGYDTVMLWLQTFFSPQSFKKNYRKITIKWSFSYNFFVTLSLYNMIQQDKFDEFISPDEGLFERNM